jgi:membrane associated rhomboid family serine protease
LWARLTLAVISGSSYGWINALVDRLEWSATIFGGFYWQSHLFGAIFGVLVMAPYAAASRLRLPRILAMCVASAAIYYYAVKFVADGPFSYNSIVPFLVSGGGAALLVGISVVMLAPRQSSWRLLGLCLVAGIVGGGAFNDMVGLGSDFGEIGGHLIWQVLVCLALHLGLRPAPG